jgi:hypothetical protein
MGVHSEAMLRVDVGNGKYREMRITCQTGASRIPNNRIHTLTVKIVK